MTPQTPGDIDALVDLLDSLCASGSQHINLETGEEMKVTTINSTDCGRLGACAVPNLDAADAESGGNHDE